MRSGFLPTKRSMYGSKPSMVSPEPIPTSPSSVSTRTTVASNRARGTGSHAAWNGGPSGNRSRRRVTFVIFTLGARVVAVGGVVAPLGNASHEIRVAVRERILEGGSSRGPVGFADRGLVRDSDIEPHCDQNALRDAELRRAPGDAVEGLTAEGLLVHDHSDGTHQHARLDDGKERHVPRARRSERADDRGGGR